MVVLVVPVVLAVGGADSAHRALVAVREKEQNRALTRRLSPIRIPGLALDPPVLLAPMASLTTPAMRILCEEAGCGLTFTEMVSAPGLVRSVRKVKKLLAPSSPGRPFGVQLVGAREGEMEEAAGMAAEAGASVIDVNMGCPARKVLKSGAGAALMQDPDRACRILEAVRRGAGDIPVTAKIRTGWDATSVNAPELSKALEEAGAAWIAVHGRTRRQVFSGPVDLETIARVVDAVSVPVIGNGGIQDRVFAEQMVAETGVAGVMVARGALGNPWIFSDLAAWARGEARPPSPDPAERARVMDRHLDLYLIEQDPERTIREMRKHLAWYAKGISGAAQFRARLFAIEDLDELRSHIRSFASHAPAA